MSRVKARVCIWARVTPVIAIVSALVLNVNAERRKTAICTSIFGGGDNGKAAVRRPPTEKNKKILKKLLHFNL